MNIREILESVARSRQAALDLEQATRDNTPELWSAFLAHRTCDGLTDYFKLRPDVLGGVFNLADGTAVALATSVDGGVITAKALPRNSARILETGGMPFSEISATLAPVEGSRLLVVSVSVQ